MVDSSLIVQMQCILLLPLLLAIGNNALQHQPIDAYNNVDDCALILDGPGRTIVYDYTYNLLRGGLPSSAGSHTCVTYDAINRAYYDARKRINVAQPANEKWKPEYLATVGELLLDISITLAHQYGLTREEIENGLPLIDTTKTLIHEVCPAFLSNVECVAGKYRRFDGLCTNLEKPTWGAALSPFARMMPPAFADGMTAPRISSNGGNLPLSRVVSRTMHPDDGFHDHAGTVMVIAWGQFMDHDYTLTATPLDPLNRNDPEECCGRPPHLKNPYCNEIIIPEDDYFYRLFNVRCHDFVRAFPAVRPECRLGSRVPFNLLTGVLDGNTVYGINDDFARKLRTGYAGLLRMNPVFSEYGLKDLLPLKLDIPDEGCTRPNRSMYCFEAGEIRVNEQLVLTCMHTLMAREHNRIAKALAQVNPHWDDETLFQEARRINVAEIQHVTYNEFLPILLGKDVMEKFGLLLEKKSYWDGYDANVNPGVIDAFAAAAFRFGHSLLPTAVERWSKAHKFIASKRLSDLIRRPWDLYRAGVIDEYFMGLMNQVAQAMDDSITQEVTNHLFKKVGARYGMDLVSFNMQRGREFGVPSYMEFRKFCGLPDANTFDELFGSMPNETIRRYSSIFQQPADVDLWSGGVSERPLPGSMLGPTFACVIATQFSNSRRGDRFWYELPNQPSSFTLDQLNEIRKSRLSRLICDNTDLIDTIQLFPMVLPDHEINPRVPCKSGVLPGIDFTKWAEFPANNYGAQYKNKVSVDLRKYIARVKNSKTMKVNELFNIITADKSIYEIISKLRQQNNTKVNRKKRSVEVNNDKFASKQQNKKYSSLADVGVKRDVRVPNDETKKIAAYTRVINNCNDDDEKASEITDLNITPIKSTYSRIVVPPLHTHSTTRMKNAKTIVARDSNLFPSPFTTDKPYINLQDYQIARQKLMGAENFFSSESAGHNLTYNPKNIPYVDVPDYTDKREESLDENDREVAAIKEKYRSNNDDVDNDTIDPGTPSNVREEEGVDIRGKSESNVQSNEDVDRKAKNAVVEADNSGNRESTELREQLKEDEEHSGDIASIENKEDIRDDVKDSTEQTSSFEPVNFDINEYRKPFNLDMFIEEMFHHNEKKDIRGESGKMANRRFLDSADDYTFKENDDYVTPFESSKHDEHYFGKASFISPSIIKNNITNNNLKKDDFQIEHSRDDGTANANQFEMFNGHSIDFNDRKRNKQAGESRERNHKNKVFKNWTMEYEYPPTKTFVV